MFCAPTRASLVMINGKVVVKERQLTAFELQPLIAQHNRLAREMVDG